MTWNGFNIAGTDVFNEVQTGFDAVKSGLETLLTAARAQAEFSKLLAGIVDDPLVLALEAAVQAVIDELEALETGGLSVVAASPYEEGIEAVYHRPTRTMTLTPESALSQIDKAFDDEGDLRRPWGSANWGGLVVVGSASGLEEFFAILAALGKFFNLDKFRKLAVKLAKHWAWLNEGFPPKKPKLSSGLDFTGVNTGDLFPAFNEVIVSFKSKVVGLKRAIISGRASWDDIIAFIDRQLEDLIALTERAQDFVDDFNFSLGGTGVYYQYFDRSSNTLETIRDGLTSGQPAEWKDHSYCAVAGVFSNTESVDRLGALLF